MISHSLPDLPELDDYVASFEKAHDGAANIDLSSFLPPTDHPLYLSVLCELVRVDLELSWRGGQPRRLEEYLGRFPGLGVDRKSLQEIAFEEYRLRHRSGQHPSPGEYEKRFGISTAGWFHPSASSRPDWDDRGTVKIGPRSSPEASWPGTVGFSLRAGAGEPLHQLSQAAPVAAERLAGALANFPEPGQTVGGFRLRSELGRGSFGRVYLAQQEHLAGRSVALKLCPEMFVTEAHTLARLQHTNIVPIHSLHPHGGLVAICMPYFGSTTLAGVLARLRQEPVRPRSGRWLAELLPAGSDSGSRRQLEQRSYENAVLWLTARAAEGLTHAHERGIVHRDLKPANILLADDGRPMLLDFNLAEDLGPGGTTAVAQAGGTLPYMAPEYLSSLLARTPHSAPSNDLYALGVILYELLTGEFPFPLPGGEPVEVIAPMLEQRRHLPPRLSSLHPSVAAIVRHCMEPDPARRYASAAELREDLDRHLERRTLLHAREPVAQRVRKWLRLHPRLISATTVGTLAGVVVLTLVAVLIARGQRQQALEAGAAAVEVRQGMQVLPSLLVHGEGQAWQVEEGLTLCQRLAERYGLLEEPRWQDGPLLRALSPPQRQEVLHDLGEMLWLWARLLLQRDGSAEQALRLNRLAEECYDADSVPAVLWRQRGEILRRAGQGEEALAYRERAATRSASPREEYLLLLDQAGPGRYLKVLPLLHEATRDGRQADLWLLLSYAHTEAEQLPRARAAAQVATSLYPDWPWAWFQLGAVCLAGKEYREARECFDRVLELRPTLAEALMNRALAFMGLGRPREAIRDLTTALELDCPYTRIYFIRAKAHEQAGDAEAARRDREEGVRRQPSDVLSWNARALAQLPGNPRAALADLEQALGLEPRCSEALRNKAHVLSEYLGRTQEALKALDRACELRGTDLLARAGRGVLLARLGKRTEAHADARQVEALASEPVLIYQAGCVYALTAGQERADRAAALRLLRKAFQHEPAWIGVALRDPDLKPLHGDPAFVDLVRLARAWYRPDT